MLASMARQRRDRATAVVEARGWSAAVSPFRGTAHSSARRVRRPGGKRQGRSDDLPRHTAWQVALQRVMAGTRARGEKGGD
jgi:hypothetical protein